MTAAKLFETGCCFCGDPERRTYGRSGRDYRYCGDCLERYDGGWGLGGEGIDAEYDRRKSPPAADRTWTPAVGEMCEGWIDAFDPANRNEANKSSGAFVRWTEHDEAELRNPESNTGFQYADRSTLRPASRPSHPEAQFYGAQPKDAELPDSIPAGSVWFAVNNPNERFEFREAARRQPIPPGSNERTDAFGYIGASDWDDTPEGELEREEADEEGRGFRSPVPASLIDWTTVPRQATHPPAPERTEPSRPAEAKVDPYGIQRPSTPWRVLPMPQKDPYRRNRELTREETIAENTPYINEQNGKERIAALTASPDPLDRLAASRAKRAAHVEAHRKDLDRSLRHPSDWDVDDAPECYSTHGSGR